MVDNIVIISLVILITLYVLSEYWKKWENFFKKSKNKNG